MNPLTNHPGYQTPASIDEVMAIVDQIRGEDGLKARAAVMMALNFAHAQVEKSLETAGLPGSVPTREAWISKHLIAALISNDYTGTTLEEDEAIEVWLGYGIGGPVYAPRDSSVWWQRCEITGLEAECMKAAVGIEVKPTVSTAAVNLVSL